MSVPDPDALPDTPLPVAARGRLYHDNVPVFFGHYWLKGTPVIEAKNALCLDYSVGKGGPLVAYRMEGTARIVGRSIRDCSIVADVWLA